MKPRIIILIIQHSISKRVQTYPSINLCKYTSQNEHFNVTMIGSIANKHDQNNTLQSILCHSNQIQLNQ